MNLEFHYYITYLIAAAAGLSPTDARIVAWSSQYVDDNDRIFTIDKDLPTHYRNFISQTINILKPLDTLMRIYPIFHFIPGDPLHVSARRKDGAMHWLNTTPGSENAGLVMDAALASGDLYRIGIACHGYADTWAHQNFVGYYNEFNSITAPLAAAIPNIGHATARHDPDTISLIWRDERLIDENIDNNARFLEAARAMLGKLVRFTTPKIGKRELRRREARLENDLKRCIGASDPEDAQAEARIARYRELAGATEYGGVGIETYDAKRWMDEAVSTAVRGLRDRGDSLIARLDPLKDIYSWKDRDNYRQTHWHRFQEAVKQHQRETWQILKNRNFMGLSLPHL